ncbi:RDD family protein [Neisseria sp. Ec49-e6-T10]|uniref:RDD family protein n=1 Tax=Neisseria sp. Ec49-e6-T10 TaxID=3140744 RepID=UPI003EBD3259
MHTQNKLDTQIVVETPEAIDIIIRPAGILPRCVAFIIDFVIRIVWFLISTYFFVFLGRFGIGLIILNLFFCLWLYFVVFELRFQGRTPGKMLMGLRVVNDDGTPVQFSASLLRNLLRVADSLPVFYTFGIIASTVHPHSKRLGDLVAGTIVVYVNKEKERPNIKPVPAIASPVVLNKEEQYAILSFAERSEKLSQERQQEVAMIIAPSLGVTPAEAVPTILGIAQNIAGKYKEEHSK